MSDWLERAEREADRLERQLVTAERKLNLAVTGLRELERVWTSDADAFDDPRDEDIAEVMRESARALSDLLARIEATS